MLHQGELSALVDICDPENAKNREWEAGAGAGRVTGYSGSTTGMDPAPGPTGSMVTPGGVGPQAGPMDGASFSKQKKKKKIEIKNEIWDDDEVDECSVAAYESRLRPEYEVLHKQTVGTNDVYLGLDYEKDPSSASCEEMLIRVEMPKETSAAEINLDVQPEQIDLRSPNYRLLLPLSKKVYTNRGTAKWEADKKRMAITLIVDRATYGTKAQHTMEALYKNTSLSLLTDQYQITMGQGYWKQGKHNQPSVFQLYFRKNPFKGCYTINAGLETALEYLENWGLSESDVKYLKELEEGGKRLFDAGYVDYLAGLKLDVKVYGVKEGDAVFPNEPLVRLEGPLLQCQLLETPLLTIIGFQSLVATKAARVSLATTSGELLDFGLRRAQGPDGGVSMSRAAYIGGCRATSNVLAGKLFGIPVKGTHSHSWVMSFEEEEDAFEAYADVFPDSTVLLVDTYDTQRGLQKAVEVGLKLAAKGHRLGGIRLDSGDLAVLSAQARDLFDKAGLQDVKIIASDDLDEYKIQDLISRGARIDVWGVGTRLATCYDQPALGCVYKLASVDEGKGRRYVMKAAVSCPSKASIPGALKVRRYLNKDGAFEKDLIHDDENSLPAEGTDGLTSYELLPLQWDGTSRVNAPRTVQDIQKTTLATLARLKDNHTRLEKPEPYTVEIDLVLRERRDALLTHLLKK